MSLKYCYIKKYLCILDLDSQIQGSEDIGKLFDRDKIVPHIPGTTPRVPHLPGQAMSGPQMPFSWSKGFSRSFSRTFRNGVSRIFL